jgi:hypothetical protein
MAPERIFPSAFLVMAMYTGPCALTAFTYIHTYTRFEDKPAAYIFIVDDLLGCGGALQFGFG